MIVDEHRVANHVPRLPFEELLNCGNWRVEQAVKLMQRTLENPTSIYRLAKQLGTSVSQLNGDFSEHANKTPASIQYLARNSPSACTVAIAEQQPFYNRNILRVWFR